MEEPIKFNRITAKSLTPIGASIFATKHCWTVQLEGQITFQYWVVQPTLQKSCWFYLQTLDESKKNASTNTNSLVDASAAYQHIWHVYDDWYQLGDDWTKLHHWSPNSILEAKVDLETYSKQNQLKNRLYKEILPILPKGYCMYAYAGEPCPNQFKCTFQHMSKQDPLNCYNCSVGTNEGDAFAAAHTGKLLHSAQVGFLTS